MKVFRPAIIRMHENGIAKREIARLLREEITVQTLSKIADNFPKRLKACIEANGGHFE